MVMNKQFCVAGLVLVRVLQFSGYAYYILLYYRILETRKQVQCSALAMTGLLMIRLVVY